ncbi:DUF4352 domain-containing protein, partial [Candidatus Woesearchaeota archaeon]|nr:DUF4352 domain-containing protein [Candidatus Woesearchaeota archaeon]
ETNIPRADTNLPSTEADETSTQEIGFIATVNGFGKENVIGNCDEYGFDCNQAGIGKIFLIIDITVENRGATNDFFENYISPSSFRIKDGDGYVYERAYVYSLEQEFPSGEIPIGEKVRGKIAFELPTAATGLKLEFEGSNIDLN